MWYCQFDVSPVNYSDSEHQKVSNIKKDGNVCFHVYFDSKPFVIRLDNVIVIHDNPETQISMLNHAAETVQFPSF